MKKTALKIFSGLCALSMIPTISVSADTVVYGDANCDGIVDICDVTALQQHIVQMNELSGQGFANADIDRDSDINVKDLAYIKKYLIKEINSLENILSDSQDNFYKLISYADRSATFNPAFITTYEDLKKVNGLRDYVFTEFDENFFENYVLYVTHFMDGTSSGTYTLKNVTADENEIILDITFVSGGAVTDDMAARVVCAGIPKSVYNSQKVSLNKDSMNICIKNTEFEADNITFFEGEYSEQEFIKFADVNVIDPYVCKGKNINSADELKAILKNVNSELSEKYDDEFFSKGNQLIIVPVVEGYTNVTYTQPYTYSDWEDEGIRNIYIGKRHSEDSVFNPQIKYLVYSSWFGSSMETSNIIFDEVKPAE
ncbi:MAG: dockerin type I repeat-containing protein [Oscillospiraceae bacterium]